jgi:hypothetical protein
MTSLRVRPLHIGRLLWQRSFIDLDPLTRSQLCQHAYHIIIIIVIVAFTIFNFRSLAKRPYKWATAYSDVYTFLHKMAEGFTLIRIHKYTLKICNVYACLLVCACVHVYMYLYTYTLYQNRLFGPMKTISCTTGSDRRTHADQRIRISDRFPIGRILVNASSFSCDSSERKLLFFIKSIRNRKK